MPLIVTDAEIHTSPGLTRRGDLLVSGTVIADRDIPVGEATIIDAAGCSVVPLLVDTVFAADVPPPVDSFDLISGRPASFAVIKGPVGVCAMREMLVVTLRDLIALVVHGQLVARCGKPILPAGAAALARDDSRLGAWTDPRRDMTQYLTQDGRYSETRSGRSNAYTGRFWLNEDRVTYLDDTGFWAFGQYHHGVLHHAGFVLHRFA